MDFKINFSGTGHKYTKEEVDVVVKAMNDADPLTQGRYRDEFETAFCRYNGNRFAFSLCNATAALEITAQLCLFKKDDEIIAPSHTFTSSVYPFVKNGAKVVWADIDLNTRVITLENIKKCVTKNTKAIVVVHLYGFIIPEISQIADFAKQNNILLIEDVAQAMGTQMNKKKAGNFGDFAIFSFHSHKNITTLGEGGILAVNDKKYADIIPMLRHNGHCSFDYERAVYWKPAMGNVDMAMLDGENLMPNNYCLGEVECALGTKLIERLDEMNEFKRKRAIKFIDELSNFKDIVFHRIDDDRHNYHLLVAYIKAAKRDELMKKLVYEKAIKCVVQYCPLNRYPLYQKLGFGKANCPNSDEFFDNMISFPFQYWMSDEDFTYMLKATKEAASEVGLN
ncbi:MULTISPECIES: DegT/DnrJ/EryC1/StrS family aminotransferase [unclassified Campylobacter]|uniref:DegT/DnrJ/EryC1/StrS aminotransferase family protein n=1 Tax=unclassified Campylobacter TaxID=2593542 RepID=UPI003D32A69A